MGYLDDIIIYSRTEKEHLEHLEEIFSRLRVAGFKLKLEKCSFFKKHTVLRTPNLCRRNTTSTGKTRKYSKNASTEKSKRSKTGPWTCRLLQKICSQIHRHFESPNTSNKDVEFKWTPECENCFQIIKEFLQQAPILKYPDPKQVTPCTQMLPNTHTQAC